jgi:GT2 family glycosyltransferase
VSAAEPIVVATVLVYGNDYGPREVLRLLAAQSRRPDVVVVVDNGSSPPLDLPAPEDLRLQLVRCPQNVGVGAGHNLAVRVAIDEWNADAVWILEHDTFPDAGCLAALLRLRAERDACVVAPEVVRNNYERHWIHDELDGASCTKFTFNGPLIDRVVLERVGAINQEFFIGQEDWEYSQRVVAVGLPIVRCSSGIVVHANKGDGRFTGAVSPTRLNYSARNLLAAQLPLTPARQLREGAFMLGKSAREVTRTERGIRHAAARWWAYWDGRSGRLGARHHRSISGPSDQATPNTAHAT